MARDKGADVRDRLVIETKTFNPMDEGTITASRGRASCRQIETSLAASGSSGSRSTWRTTSTPTSPQEETLSAFDELVRSGKVGAVGASNFTADQLAEALEISELEGLARYEWVQNSYSLLDRDDARDRLPGLP